MVREVYGVHLSVPERGRLKKMIRPGRSSAQAVTRARILLKTDEEWTASRVAAALDVLERTVRRAKRRYVDEGLKEVLRHHNSPTPTARWMRRWRPTPYRVRGRLCTPSPMALYRQRRQTQTPPPLPMPFLI